jgi:hypothetical protein
MQPIPLETQVLITLWYFLIPNATDLLLDDLGFVNPVMKMIDDLVDTVLQDQKRFILWPICNLTFQTFTLTIWVKYYELKYSFILWYNLCDFNEFSKKVNV